MILSDADLDVIIEGDNTSLQFLPTYSLSLAIHRQSRELGKKLNPLNHNYLATKSHIQARLADRRIKPKFGTKIDFAI